MKRQWLVNPKKNYNKRRKSDNMLSVSYENFEKSCNDGVIALYSTKQNCSLISHYAQNDSILIRLYNNEKHKKKIVRVTYKGHRIMDSEEMTRLINKYDWTVPPVLHADNNWRLKILFVPVDVRDLKKKKSTIFY